MTTLTKKFSISFFRAKTKQTSAPTFFDLARKNIVKAKKGVGKNLSKKIDKIVYGG